MSAQGYAFFVLWALVVAVSVYDGFWVLVTREVIQREERNPVGRLLIELNGGDVWLLLGLKAAGTVCAGALLLVLYWTWPRIGWAACFLTAAMQLVLAVYLTAS